MTVRENVEYGLKIKKVAERRAARARRGGARASSACRRSATRKPAQLSGGQRQRVALARAIVNRPQRAAARRAARRARPQAAPGDAVRAQADPARGRDHVRLRHPRPGGGADDERPPGRVRRGPDRAGRRAGRGLRAPGDDVRRRLRRHVERARARRAPLHGAPGEDPHPGAASPPTGSTSSAARVDDVSYVGPRHALHGRARRGRRAAGRAPEPRDVVATRRSQLRGRRGAVWRGGRSRPSPSRRSRRRRKDHEGVDRGRRRSPSAPRSSSPRAAADDSGSGASNATGEAAERSRSPGPMQQARRRRGRAEHHRLGRLRRGRLDRPEGRLGHAVRAEDRLPGQRQGRQHLATRWSR